MGTSIQKIHMVRSLTRTTAHETKAPGLRVMSREDIPNLGLLSALVRTGHHPIQSDFYGENESPASAVPMVRIGHRD